MKAILWTIFVHSAGIYLFLRGFLLTRLSLTNTSTTPPPLEPSHSRAILLIIDALRFDFLSPNGPLSLPHQLTQSHPGHSFIFNSHADPPTTTLQRIKGITTGSLPTFVDMGSNFAASSIEEDSFISQLLAAEKKIAFMGDNTWISVYPDAFTPNLTFPYDSFNVEDLHTVDTGVASHLLPLLTHPTSHPPWDVLIAHFLGVDHVGHRLGPNHPTMAAKLQEMDDVLRQVVDLMDEDTLLVVFGDHGMDSSGDHGGDGELETSAAMWFYSKTRPFSTPVLSPRGIGESHMYHTKPFSDIPHPHRAIQQIDLLPTLSLLLGLPIPFNNLGAVIPEAFPASVLSLALEANAAQVRAYLDAYHVSAAGGELDSVWGALESAWAATLAGPDIDAARFAYIRAALEACRGLWARFDIVLMVLGLALLFAGTLGTWALYSGLAHGGEVWVDKRLAWSVRGAAGGAILGMLAQRTVGSLPVFAGVDALDAVLFTASLVSSLVIVLSSRFPLPSPSSLVSILPLILHTLAFLSNSYTVWEDRLAHFLLLSTLTPGLLTGLSAPTPRLRARILISTGVFALCARLMNVSTVCREEQAAQCTSTFFSSAYVWAAPLAAIALPFAVTAVLKESKSYNAVAPLALPGLVAPALMLGTAHWVFEVAETAGVGLDMPWRTLRTGVAWLALVLGAILPGVLWYALPVCLSVSSSTSPTAPSGPQQQQQSRPKQITILGTGNAYGAPYLVFWCLPLTAVWLASQSAAQVVLLLGAVALLAHLAAIDGMRDARALDTLFASSTPSAALTVDLSSPGTSYALSSSGTGGVRFSEITPLALLGTQLFFGTGHQAALPSMQWKTAFVLTGELVYPWSVLTVVLNTLGPIILVAVGAPLLGLWNVSAIVQPGSQGVEGRDKKKKNSEADAKVKPLQSPASYARTSARRASLGLLLYYSVLLIGALGAAGALRRHLMVWKVWAPRVGLAVLAWGAVALGVVLGEVGVKGVMGRRGVRRVLSALAGGKK